MQHSLAARAKNKPYSNFHFILNIDLSECVHLWASHVVFLWIEATVRQEINNKTGLKQN